MVGVWGGGGLGEERGGGGGGAGGGGGRGNVSKIFSKFEMAIPGEICVRLCVRLCEQAVSFCLDVIVFFLERRDVWG